MTQVASKEEAKFLIASVIQLQHGRDPMPYAGLCVLGLPGETMGQIASRLEQLTERTIGKQWQNYGGMVYSIYIGELTHMVAPLPPPPPREVIKVTQIPVAVPRRAVAAPKLKMVKPA